MPDRPHATTASGRSSAACPRVSTAVAATSAKMTTPAPRQAPKRGTTSAQRSAEANRNVKNTSDSVSEEKYTCPGHTASSNAVTAAVHWSKNNSASAYTTAIVRSARTTFAAYVSNVPSPKILKTPAR